MTQSVKYDKILYMGTVESQLKKLPDAPGIYLFFDKDKKLIYVGKATSLKSRVKSYFIGKRLLRPIEQMIDQVKYIKCITTDSVLEAVIVESLYIKKYKPVYNVLGKDDKSWNYITVSKDIYPIVDTMREHEYSLLKTEGNGVTKQFAYVFGPYPGLNTRATMKLLRRIFKFSSCQKTKKRNTQKTNRPCFYFEIGECLGVCTGDITPKDYKQKVIRPLVMFLKGNKKQLVKGLEKEMAKAAKKEDYEEAARLRDQLTALLRIQDIALLNQSFFNDDVQRLPPKTDSVELNPKIISTRIEGYDISNLGRTGKVGSMVVFNIAGPVKSQYRKFKIRSVEGQSDVDCLKEVLKRRLTHIEWPLPQVFLIDGGLPQVNAALEVIRGAGVQVPVVGIAKGPDRKKNEFILGTKTTQFIQWVSKNKTLLVAVRDEAHRFAITYQRILRKIKK